MRDQLGDRQVQWINGSRVSGTQSLLVIEMYLKFNDLFFLLLKIVLSKFPSVKK